MKASAKKELTQFLANNDTSSINNICTPLYELGLKGFYYVKVYPNGTIVDLTTDLNWAEHYLKKFFNCEYSLSDMSYNCLSEGINLWELNKENQIWKEGRELFNAGNGFSMAMPSTNFTELFFYYAAADNYKVNELYLNNLDIFKNFSVYFRERAAKLIKNGENYKLTIPAYYRPTILQNPEPQSHNTIIEKYYSLLDTKRFYVGKDYHYLTYREAECLYWYTLGKTIKETALILGLSSKTIATHLDNIKLKLDCHSKTALTTLVFNYGIADFFQRKLN